MPSVTRPANQPGEFLVDYEEKVFPDVKAEPGEKALLTFHTVCLLYTSPSPRDKRQSRMPSSA